MLLTTTLPTKVLRLHYQSLEDNLSGLQGSFARRLREYVGLFRSLEGEGGEAAFVRGLKKAKRLLVRIEDELEECEGLLDEAVEVVEPGCPGGVI
jgi:hypothetical protein